MTPKERRQLLLTEMETLESQGMDCRGCKGTCCTYEANSMMVTPVEAVELLTYLRTENLLTEALKAKVTESITKFRLDHPAGNGKRSFLRRTYTCPFFNHGELGCPLPREVKPYGCLAFNSHHRELKADANCFSDIPLLSRQDASVQDTELNEELKKELGIFWEKTPLPMALIDLWEKDLPKI